MNGDLVTADELRRLTDELFITTDLKTWNAARALFVDGPIEVDMSSLAGGPPVQMMADQLVDGFRVSGIPPASGRWIGVSWLDSRRACI